MTIELTTAFVAKLAFDFPELLPILGKQLETDDCREIYPHALMCDYTRYISSQDKIYPWVKNFITELENNFRSVEDDSISNLIAVSFIEPFVVDAPSIGFANELLSPKLKEYYERVSGGYLT